MPAGGNKAVFLDRDGTINVEKGYLWRISEFEYLDGAVDGLRALAGMGFLLVVVTNQSGIARGYYTESDFKRLDGWMRRDLLTRGVTVSATYHCPHLPDGKVRKYAAECTCRKPGTALFWRAAADLGIDMGRSFAVGDRERDLAVCRESGVRGILLSDGREDGSYYTACRDWGHVVEVIMSEMAE